MRFTNDKPIFAQIAELLAAEIRAGRLGAGTRLPSARDLAADLQVNPNTAARALQDLADSGLARVERGTGYFVAERAADLARESRRKAFFEEELPRVFATMEELGIAIEEILERHAARAAKGAKT